jgi:hypothetical protein
MMENPATWGSLEHAVDSALRRADKANAEMLVGLSRTRIVADAVRAWLTEHGDTQQVRERVAEALWTAFREDSGFVEAVMAVVAPIVAERDAAVERAERAEAEVQRLAAASDSVLDVIERDGLTDREREVFIKLVQFVDRQHWYETNDCHPVRGDDCSPYCGACEVLRHVDDQLLREAREVGGYARP